MEPMAWNENLDAGIEEVNSQHRFIILLVERLCHSIRKKKDKAVISTIIKELDFYFVKHFKTEEHYMAKYNFGNTKAHKEAHRFFKKTYEQIRYSYFYVDSAKMPKEKTLRTFSLHLCRILSEWLEIHFSTHDGELIKFLRTKIKEQA